MQSTPEFDQIIRAIETVGFPIVVAVILLLLIWLILSGIGAQIGGAVTLFSGTLSQISTRQEEASDRVVDTLSSLTDTVRKQGELIAAMNESVRIQLTMTSQQMSQQAALTQKVSDAAGGSSVVGVIKPVETEGGTS